MALTPSTLLPTAEALRHKPVLALLLSCHCPFVKHCEAEISRLQVDLGDRALLIGIASNSSRSFPYRLDTSQALARAVQAACTPDPFQPPRQRPAQRWTGSARRPGPAEPGWAYWPGQG